MTQAPVVCLWPAGPAEPRLATGEIHVWGVSLDQPASPFEPLLEPAEIERANRFRFAKLRQHFVVGRGALRVLLGRYLSAEPAGLQFAYGPQGKPSLIAPTDLRFNVAHSHGLALVGIAHNELGIDVEMVRSLPDRDQIARRFFSSAEVERLDSVAAGQKTLAFFYGWTRKEAVIKASGHGLSLPLNSFSVSLQPGEPARMLAVSGADAEEWQLFALEPARGYVGAVAVGRGNWQLRCWSW